jgi:hypothetical protein
VVDHNVEMGNPLPQETFRSGLVSLGLIPAGRGWSTWACRTCT